MQQTFRRKETKYLLSESQVRELLWLIEPHLKKDKYFKGTNMGSLFELTYDVETKPKINEKEFIDKIRVKNGNLKVTLSHPLVEGEL